MTQVEHVLCGTLIVTVIFLSGKRSGIKDNERF